MKWFKKLFEIKIFINPYKDPEFQVGDIVQYIPSINREEWETLFKNYKEMVCL